MTAFFFDHEGISVFEDGRLRDVAEKDWTARFDDQGEVIEQPLPPPLSDEAKLAIEGLLDTLFVA